MKADRKPRHICPTSIRVTLPPGVAERMAADAASQSAATGRFVTSTQLARDLILAVYGDDPARGGE